MRFFFYGTLMDRDVLSAVLGRRVKRSDLKSARVKGYRRASVRGLDYPIVAPDKSAFVAGVMLDRATNADFNKLNAYEEGYRLVHVPVQSPGALHAKAYLFAGEPEAITIAGKFWSLTAWRKRYKAAALAWIIRQKWRRL
jgi:gamma-glutamylcyclotransferase (GGCT)/AIG2-like uncharacterized protein YtfP